LQFIKKINCFFGIFADFKFEDAMTYLEKRRKKEAYTDESDENGEPYKDMSKRSKCAEVVTLKHILPATFQFELPHHHPQPEPRHGQHGNEIHSYGFVYENKFKHMLQ
jgi:hypothetical protein